MIVEIEGLLVREVDEGDDQSRVGMYAKCE